MLAFFIGYNFIKKSKINRKRTPLIENYLSNDSKLIVNMVFIFIMVILSSISIQYYISQIMYVSVPENNFNESLNIYRQAYLQGQIQIPFYIRQINRISMVMTYISCYSLASKLILKKSPLNIIISIIVIVLFIISNILQSARTNIVYILLALLIYIVIFYVRKNRKKIPVYINIKIFLVSIVFMSAFATMGTFMGRSGQEDIWRTISFYFASGMLGLNQAFEFNNIYISKYFGEGTFSGIWRCINDYIIYFGYDFKQPFSNINGMSIGNTYTSIYKYYCDFNYWGVFIIVCVIAYFSNRFYNKVINEDCGFMFVILFGYFIHGIIFFFYDELLLSTQLSFGLICDIIYFYIIKKMIFKG